MGGFSFAGSHEGRLPITPHDENFGAASDLQQQARGAPSSYGHCNDLPPLAVSLPDSSTPLFTRESRGDGRSRDQQLLDMVFSDVQLATPLAR